MEFDFHHDRGRGLLLQPLRIKNGYVATLCDRNNWAILRNLNQICCDFVRPKKGMLRPLRLKWVCCDFVRPKNLRDFARNKTDIMRLCATQNRCVATLRDPKKVCCGHCDSKKVCCDFAQPKWFIAKLRDPKNVCCDHCDF